MHLSLTVSSAPPASNQACCTRAPCSAGTAGSAGALLRARPDIEQLRVNYQCEAILDREGLT